MRKNHKIIFLALHMAVLMAGGLLLSGCGKQELGEEYEGEVNTLQGAELIVDEETVTSGQIAYTITNETDFDLAYGQDYGLQKEEDGKWYAVIPKNEVAVTLEMLWAGPGSVNTHEVNWEASYGKLKAGHYRIIKSVSDETQGYVLAGEFNIK